MAYKEDLVSKMLRFFQVQICLFQRLFSFYLCAGENSIYLLRDFISNILKMLHGVRVHTHTETKIAIFAANVNLIMTAIDFGNEILCCTTMTRRRLSWCSKCTLYWLHNIRLAFDVIESTHFCKMTVDRNTTSHDWT